MSERAARSIGSVIDAAIAKLEEKIQAMVAKIGDKSAEFKEKYVDPLMAKFEEVKNSPAIQEKLQILSDLYQDIKDLASRLISGGTEKRSIGSTIDSIIARVEARIRLLAEKLQDKYTDARERFLVPLLDRLEELKNSPAVKDKVKQIWNLLDDAREMARNLLLGESRPERSIGSAIDAAIAKVEEKLQLILAKVNDKTGEIKEKYIDPLIARFEEVKNSPAISEKISMLREVYADVRDLAKKLLFGKDHERTERSIGAAIDAAIDRVEEQIRIVAAKVDDKTGEFKEKFLDPLLAKFEELKLSETFFSKLQGLGDLYQELKALIREIV